MHGSVKPALAHRAVASVFGIGFLPMAPGTWASLLAAVSWYLLQPLIAVNAIIPWILVGSIVLLGWLSVHRLHGAWGEDPSQVVVDEWAGTWIACLLLPFSIPAIAASVLFFRFFDILKPLGIRRLEKLHGPAGIMLDDILAGLYANFAVHLLLAFQILS